MSKTFVGLVVVLLIIWGLVTLFTWATSSDVDQWQKIDDGGRCYVHVTEDQGMWPYQGDGPEHRTTYCREP